jgi:tetratricopeptide (TPR) repeat protein
MLWIETPSALAVPPVVRLTVDPPDFVLTHDAAVGGLLLRELQRQAVLIAARDELGLTTRDAVLGDPASNVTLPLRAQTRVWRADRAELQLSLARSAPTGPWLSFPLTADPLVDYPAFVTQCEAASRGAYLVALRALVDVPPQPIRWTDGPADPAARTLLSRMDVFSQFRAVQRLHAQIRADGASPDRLSALVLGYANLGLLAGEDWSADSRAYAARSLLYAERLVVHENRSAGTLYVRAYARALADLDAAALADLDAAAADAIVHPPSWTATIRAYCRRDLAAAAAQRAVGPASVRPLAGLLAAIVSFDGHATSDVARATMDALATDAGPVALMTAVSTVPDPAVSRLHQAAADVLTLLAREQLGTEPLPPVAAAAVAGAALAAPKPDDQSADPSSSFAALAKIRDGLARAATPDDRSEPSYAALAALVEQQAFLAVVTRATSLRSDENPGGAASYAAAAGPIIGAHPWGPYVVALCADPSARPRPARQMLNRVPPTALGPWADRAVDADDATPVNAGLARSVEQRWRRPARLLADAVLGDYSPAVAGAQSARAFHGDAVACLAALRRVDPHSALLTAAWMDAVEPDGRAVNTAVYEPTLAQVEAEFTDRPTLVTRAADWCQARGQFDRELTLLRGLDAVAPTPDLCDRLARVARRTGHPDAAVDYCLRGQRLCDPTQADRAIALSQLAATGLIADGRFDAAEAILRLHPTDPNGLDLMARCAERAGHLDEAEAWLREQSSADPLSLARYAMWAQLNGRPSAAAVHAKAAVAGDDPIHRFYLATADGHADQALAALRHGWQGLTDAAALAELSVAATAAGDGDLARRAVARLRLVAVAPARPFALAYADLFDDKSDVVTFDVRCDRLLDDDLSADWHGVAGRYLLAAAHPANGRAELTLALASPAHERTGYLLARWAARP